MRRPRSAGSGDVASQRDGQRADDDAAAALNAEADFGQAGASVIVTGAGGGIGKAIARAFGRAGATVIVHYRSNRSGAESLAAEIAGKQGKGGGTAGTALLFEGDLTKPGVAESLAALAVERTGRLDVLVNNAALQPVTSLTEMTMSQWQEVVDTNLHATFACSKAAAAEMIRRETGGSIIHIASIEASQPAALHAHYASSKAAVVMHARSAALELGRYGIRVNSVSPGLVARPGLTKEWPEGVARYETAAPLSRLVEADEVAAACLFLASPFAAAITGHDLVIDAGVSCHPTW